MTNKTFKDQLNQNFADFLKANDMRGGIAYLALNDNKTVGIALHNVGESEILALVANLVGSLAVKKGVSAKSIYDELTITTPDATRPTDTSMN